VLLSLIVLTFGVALFPLLRSGDSADDCASVNFCVYDSSARLPLSPAEQVQLASLSSDVSALVATAVANCEPVEHGGSARQGGGECAPGPVPSPAGIRQQLVLAGFFNVVVRPARPSDQAPPSAIVYAVRVGSGCLVGSFDVAEPDQWNGIIADSGPVTGFRTGLTVVSIVGPQLDGACLDP
jgi:hypothetical protein